MTPAAEGLLKELAEALEPAVGGLVGKSMQQETYEQILVAAKKMLEQVVRRRPLDYPQWLAQELVPILIRGDDHQPVVMFSPDSARAAVWAGPL